MNIPETLAKVSHKQPVVVFEPHKKIWRTMFLQENSTRFDRINYKLLIAYCWFNLMAFFVAGVRERSIFEKIEVLSPSYCLFGGLLAYQTGNENPRLMFQLISHIQAIFDLRLAVPKDRSIIMATQIESVALFKVFSVMISFSIVGLVCMPGLMYLLEYLTQGKATLELPIPGVYPWSTEMVPNFIFTYLLQAAVIGYICPMIISNAMTPVSFCLALVAQFRMTQERYKEIKYAKSEKDALNLLKVAIRSQQRALTLLKTVERLGRKRYFFLVFMSALAMSLGLFRIMNTNDFAKLILFAVMCMDVTFQLFFICLYGQKVINEVNRLCFVIYEVQWLEQSAVFKRCFLFVLCRVQRTDRLTAWGFTDVSLETFNAVITTACSYLAFLQTVLEREDSLPIS